MFENSPILTTAGLELLLRAIEGEHVTFTRFKVGTGVLPAGTAAEDLTDLVDAKLAFPIAAKDDSTPKTLKISGHFSSLEVAEDFRLRELGLFAKGEDNVEVLYCYDYDAAGAGTVRANGCAVLTEQEVSMIVAIDEAQNISVELKEGILYALKSDFDAHVAEQTNPHHVTLDQIAAAGGILPVENGGTGAGTLAGLMAGLLDFRGQTQINNLDTIGTPGLYYVFDNESLELPFTHKDNQAMDGLLMVSFSSLLGMTVVHQLLISDSVPHSEGFQPTPFGLEVEILRRRTMIVDGVLQTESWSAWE